MRIRCGTMNNARVIGLFLVLWVIGGRSPGGSGELEALLVGPDSTNISATASRQCVETEHTYQGSSP